MLKTITRRPRVHGIEGFSMLELVFALVLMAIGLMGVAAVFPLGTRFVNAGKITSSALAMAGEKMEELQSVPASSAALQAGTYSDEIGPFQRQWVITDDTPMSGMKQISVTTTWQSPQGTRHVTLETYVFR